MNLSIHSAPEFFALRGPWCELHRESRAEHPFASHAWLSNWLAAFGAARHEVVVVRDNERLVGGWVAERTAGGLTALDEHTYSSGPIARDKLGLEAFFAALSQHGVRRLSFHGLRTPTGREALTAAAGARFAVIEKEPWVMRRIAFEGSLDDYLATRDGRSRAELKRKRRRLGERAPRVGLVRLGRAEADRAADLVEDVERDSWKNEAGTAIVSSPEESAFYRGVLALGADAGEPLLFALLEDGRPLAFVLGLLHGRAFYALKTSYRRAVAEHSPGIVLFLEVIDALARSGEADGIELLGRDSRWKRDVATEAREHCVHELVARDATGRLYALAHTHVRPLLARLQQGRGKP